MQRHIQWRRRGEIRMKFDCPRQVTLFAPAASGHEASDASDCLANHNTGSKYVHRSPRRQLLTLHIEDRHQQRHNESAVKNTRSLQRFHRKDLAWILDVIT